MDEESAKIIEKLNELSSQQPEASQTTIAKDDIFSQVVGPERRGHVRTYGLGPSPSDFWGTTPTHLKTMRMASEARRAADEEVCELKEKVQTMMQMLTKLQQQMDFRDNQNQQFAPTQPHRTRSDPSKEVCNEAGTSHATQNPRPSSSSSSCLPSSQGTREVLLLSPSTPDVIVARGLILSNNPYTKVRGVE